MYKELVKLANHLDSINHRDLADRLDGVIKTATYLPNEPIDDTGSDDDVVSTPMLDSLKDRLSDAGLDPTKAEELVSLWPKYSKNIRGRHLTQVPNLSAYGYFKELHRYVSSGGVDTWADKKVKANSVYSAISKAHAESVSNAKVEEEVPPESSPMAAGPATPKRRAQRKGGSKDTSIHKIQRIIGANDDGSWGGKTQAALKKYLEGNKEYIIGGWTNALKWGSNHKDLGVKNYIDAGGFGPRANGLLAFLEAIEGAKREAQSDQRDRRAEAIGADTETEAAAAAPTAAAPTAAAPTRTISIDQKKRVIKQLSRGLGGSAREDAGLANTWTIEGRREAAIKYIMKNNKGMAEERAKAIVADLEAEARTNMGMKEALTQEALINKRAEDLSRLFSIQDIPSVRR